MPSKELNLILRAMGSHRAFKSRTDLFLIYIFKELLQLL